MQRDGQELVTGPKPPPGTRYQRSPRTTATQNAEWSVSVQRQVGGHRIMDDMLEGQAIQEFADNITSQEWPAYRAGPMWPVVIIIDNDTKTGLYQSGTITVPHRVRTIVLLHELAHHLASAVQGFAIEHHDIVWVRAYLELIEYTYGMDIAGKYRRAFLNHGVAV